VTEVLVRDQPKNAGQLIQYGPLEADRAGVLSSYQSHFNYQAMRDGLRSAQRGAVAALQAHWTVSREPAVLVLPTGSGKTETMLTLLAEGLLDRLLVVVPWVPLRDQTVRKFGSMGLLRKIGILPPQAPNPVVAVGMHRFKSSTDVSELLDECNVFVANVQSIIGSKDEALEKLAEKFSHVFIDEAHHLAAPTWTALQNYFSKVPIVLFTATPFRRDGKKIDGKVIYNFPLRLAQEQGFFQPITFRPVYEFSKEKSDRAIAHEAVRVLRRDLELRLDHILLARADLVQRADDLLEVYQAIAPDLNPVVIHSNTKKLRKVNQEALNNRKSRILICVDMFGEGFDFAQLKVAALHDVHKSLAITLQFFGRFARAEENVGSATVVANLGEVRVEDALRELYAEDADWNLVLNVLSSTATGRVKRRSELLSSFPTLPDISIQNLFPKMSTTVFRTKCETWEPGNLASAWNAEQLYWGPSVSTEHCTAVAVIRVDTPVLWGEIKDLCNTQWHLFVLHWSEADKALFIYSSDKESLHEDVAATVCGEDCELLQGESVYRCFDGVSRVVLTNLGLNNHAGDSLSHEMLTGPDVGEAVSPQKLQKRTKTNVFGRGYDAQGSASRGCSTKGRIWSHRVADDISDWVDWCKLIGAKVLDETISEAAFLKGVMKTRKPTSRPPLVPLAIDWPLAVWKKAEPTSLSWNSNDCAFHNCELNLLNHEREGDILFEVL
jgi:superfamily II DNA or RNA helicase